MTCGFNESAMEKLRNGELFGIVCTDVAGMGIDIPDVDYIIQLQLAEDYPTICQRNGRAARGKGKKGKSIVLFEPRFRRKEKKFGHSKKRALESQEEVLSSTSKRQRTKENADEDSQLTEQAEDEPTVEMKLKSTKSKSKRRKRKCADDLDQVIDSFINADLDLGGPKCRRQAGNQFFANPAVPKDGDSDYCCSRCCPPPPSPTECCDVCNPSLVDFLYEDMDKPKRKPRQPAPTPLKEDDSSNWNDTDRGLEEALYIWRDETANAKWGPYHPVGGLGIIDDEQIERIVKLARRGLIPTVEVFKHELKWLYMLEHGVDILNIVHTSHPPLRPEVKPTTQPDAPQPKPRAPPRCSACGTIGHTRASLRCGVRVAALAHTPAPSSHTLLATPSATTDQYNHRDPNYPAYASYSSTPKSSALNVPSSARQT